MIFIWALKWHYCNQVGSWKSFHEFITWVNFQFEWGKVQESWLATAIVYRHGNVQSTVTCTLGHPVYGVSQRSSYVGYQPVETFYDTGSGTINYCHQPWTKNDEHKCFLHLPHHSLFCINPSTPECSFVKVILVDNEKKINSWIYHMIRLRCVLPCLLRHFWAPAVVHMSLDYVY